MPMSSQARAAVQTAQIISTIPRDLARSRGRIGISQVTEALTCSPARPPAGHVQQLDPVYGT